MSEEVNLVILPGSRNFEVQNLLPKFIETLKKLRETKKVNAILVQSPNVKAALYRPYMNHINEVFPDSELTTALKKGHLCVAASGTVTLACALFEVPTVVCYETSLLNAYIFYTFINYKGFGSLANIVHQEEIFPECIQERADLTNMMRPLEKWISDRDSYESLKKKLSTTKDLLQGDDSTPGVYMAEVINTAYGDAK